MFPDLALKRVELPGKIAVMPDRMRGRVYWQVIYLRRFVVYRNAPLGL